MRPYFKYFSAIIPVGLFILVFTTSSCQKCETCKVKDQIGNTIYFSPEICGSGGTIQAYKVALEQEWRCINCTVLDSIGNTIHITHQFCGDFESRDQFEDSINLMVIPWETYDSLGALIATEYNVLLDTGQVICSQLPTTVFCEF